MRRFLVALALILVSAYLPSQGLEDLYPEVFGEAFGTNTGLTVFPSLSIPFGGEYESMATAYTAVGRDVSFFEANPAASATVATTQLAFHHNNLIADLNLDGLLYTMRLEDLGLGFAAKYMHAPFTEYDILGRQVQSTRYSETVIGANVSYNIGRNFFFHGLSVGSNLKVAYRNMTTRPGQSAAGFMADIGVLTRFDFLKPYYSRSENFAVGLTVRNIGPDVLGEPLPAGINAGIAYSPLRPLLIASDLSIPIRFNPAVPLPDVSWAVGLALSITDFMAVQTGFQLKGGNPRISIGTAVDLNEIALHLNYTLDMTTQFSRPDRFSIQARLDFGDFGREERRRRIDALYLDGLEAYAEGDLETAIANFERALELDEGFVPAENSLALARRQFELNRRLEALSPEDIFGSADDPQGIPEPADPGSEDAD